SFHRGLLIGLPRRRTPLRTLVLLRHFQITASTSAFPSPIHSTRWGPIAKSHASTPSRQRSILAKSLTSQVASASASISRARAATALAISPMILHEAILKMLIFACERESKDLETFVRRRSMSVTLALDRLELKSARWSCAIFD